MDLIKIAEEAFATKKELPSFKSGDTITVAYRIKEGNKERIQQYRGVVIRISGHGDKKRFTVRKMSENVGVERIFPIESPFIESITVNKPGSGRADHNNIRFLNLNIIIIGYLQNTFIMVIDRNRQITLGIVLPDNILIEKCFYLFRFR